MACRTLTLPGALLHSGPKLAGITRYNSMQVTIVIFHNTNKCVFEKIHCISGGPNQQFVTHHKMSSG